MLVMSLEEYDEVTGKAAKAAIMQKDVVGRKPPVTTVASAEEGLLASLDQHGAVDLPFIARSTASPGTGHRRAGRPDLPDPGNENLADGRRLPLRQRAGQARRGGSRRPRLRPQRRGPAERAAGGRAARRHRRQSRRAVDSRIRHPGLRRRPVQRPALIDPGGAPAQRRRVEHRRRLRHAAVGRRDLRLRHAPRQRHVAPGAGAEHEDAGDLRSRSRRSRQARGQPGGDAGRQGETAADQGEVPLLGVRRPRTHRAAGAALQRHLQQPAPPPLRRLAPRLPRHEPDHPRCVRIRRTPFGAA